jgi:hypothetical protein
MIWQIKYLDTCPILDLCRTWPNAMADSRIFDYRKPTLLKDPIFRGKPSSRN